MLFSALSNSVMSGDAVFGVLSTGFNRSAEYLNTQLSVMMLQLPQFPTWLNLSESALQPPQHPRATISSYGWMMIILTHTRVVSIIITIISTLRSPSSERIPHPRRVVVSVIIPSSCLYLM